MSTEAQTRPAASRGRGGGRGGRGGQSRGGARQQTRANGDKFDSLDAIEDEGEIGELKKLYGAKTALIKEMFSDWSEVDILFVLQETDGDENLAVTRIADGKQELHVFVLESTVSLTGFPTILLPYLSFFSSRLLVFFPPSAKSFILPFFSSVAMGFSCRCSLICKPNLTRSLLTTSNQYRPSLSMG